MSWLTRTSASATAASFAGGIVAEPRQRRRRARAGDQAMRQRQVERRQVGGDVAQDVRRGAALAEADDRPERGIVGDLDPQFAPADRLALHQQRRTARVDRLCGVPRDQQIGRPAPPPPASCRSSASPPEARASGRTLWRSFTTAGKPSSVAAAAASAGEATARLGTTGTP